MPLRRASIAPLAALSLFAACSDEPKASSTVAIAPTILVPRGLLDNVQTLTVSVYDQANGVDCDMTTHKVVGAAPTTSKVASINLKNAGCAPPAKFCGDLPISRSDTPRVFGAVAFGASGDELADGCAVAVANQEQVALTIPMVRYLPPSVCGDNQVGPVEQCEPPGSASDQVCDASCHSKEEYLSHGDGTVTIDGSSGDKRLPAFVWPSQSGATGRFFATWEDRSPKTKTQIAMRVLGDALANDPALGPSPSTVAFFVPDNGGQFPPQSQANDQSAPSLTVINGKVATAFADDSGGQVHVALRTLPIANPTAGDQPPAQPIVISDAGALGFAPSVAAGAGGFVFVAWQSAASVGPGQIVGRAYNVSSGTRSAQIEISSGANNQDVRVAATSSGWVAVWQDGSDIKLRMIKSDGTASAPEQVVNDASHHGAQDHPKVASLADGRFAVAWADHGASGGTDIFVQRYQADGTPVPQDQGSAVNNVVTMGEQVTPSIAAGSAAGGMFAVAWLDQSSNHVRARLVGAGGGFLFNNVDGQTNEFQASVVDGHPRANPTVAIGGSGPFIAIGWEDLDVGKPGIYARRFPSPQ